MDPMRSHAENKKPQLIKYLYDFIRIACKIQKDMTRSQIGDLSKRMPYREDDVNEQANNFDCGIHMLVNAEIFFINTFGIRNEVDPEVEFRLNNARKKRTALRKLIRRLAEMTDFEKAVMNSRRS